MDCVSLPHPSASGFRPWLLQWCPKKKDGDQFLRTPVRECRCVSHTFRKNKYSPRRRYLAPTSSLISFRSIPAVILPPPRQADVRARERQQPQISEGSSCPVGCEKCLGRAAMLWQWSPSVPSWHLLAPYYHGEQS